MLSIIIPTLNEEKIIAQTLADIKKLNSVKYELIVSDGGSTDKTVEIAKKYADFVVENTTGVRQTIGAGRNHGAAAASGEILVFLDADVTVPDINNFFNRAVKYFEDASIVALTGYLKVFPKQATLLDRFFFSEVNFQNYILNNFLHHGAAAGEFQMMRASAFKKLGGYLPHLAVGEDMDMFARLGKIGRTRACPDLKIYHTSRRAHAIGWPKLLWLWWLNFFYLKILHRSYSKEWEVIR